MDDSLIAMKQELVDLRVRLATRDAELSRLRQQYLIANSLWKSLQQSRPWKLLTPLRGLRRWLSPRGFDQYALIPCQQLQWLAPGSWRARGSDPQFVVPCLLPAGWLQVQLHMSSATPARVELLADFGNGFCASEYLLRVECHGAVQRDEIMYLPRPARGIRFDPRDAPGDFRLECLRIQPLSGFEVIRRDFREKWKRLWTKSAAIKDVQESDSARVEPVQLRAYRVTLDSPLVSIIIPCAGRPARRAGTTAYHLERCVSRIRGISTYSNFELIVVHDGMLPDDLAARLGDCGVHSIVGVEPLTPARAWNQGAAAANGSMLLFMQEDLEIVTPDWLEAMLVQATQAEAGVVVATVRFDSPCETSPQAESRDQAADCLMTPRNVLNAVGGFTEELGQCYAPADYCLKARALGKAIIAAPHLLLCRRTSRSRLGTYAAELQAFQARWPQLEWNPSLNPNLSQVVYDHRR